MSFFQKKINKNLYYVSPEDVREYLCDYQNIHNCTNVTLDNIRRILSSFYRWLEQEDCIIKSPMVRIHKIKSPVKIKPVLTDEEIELRRKTAAFSRRKIAIIDLLLSSGI